MEVNNKLIYLISGMPNNGKTYLAHYTNTLYPNSIIIHTDDIIIDFVKEKRPERVEELNDIFTLFESFSTEDIQEFLQHFDEGLKKYFNSTFGVLIIEGYIVERYCDQIKECFPGSEFIFVDCVKTQTEYNYRINDVVLNNYIDVVCYVQKLVERKLAEKTTYQYFPELGQKKTNSDTALKFELMGLNKLRPGSKFIDIGCNAGYFVIMAAKQGARLSIGVDAYREFIDIASLYSNAVFHQLGNVRFYHEDIFQFKTDYKFDHISCASTFHYFRERQKEFIGIIYDLLEPGGLFHLEIGVGTENENEAFVQKYSRSIDSDPCYYPNHKALSNYFGKFEILSISPSVNQSGDAIPRFVYILKK